MRLKLLLIPVLVLAGALGISTRADVHAAQSFTINVGGGGMGIAANNFFPHSITVHKGDTIHFTNPYEEPHTTTFVPVGTSAPPLLIANPGGPGQVFNPTAQHPAGSADFDPHSYYNSGFMFKDASADVNFPVLGTFKFICLFVPSMEMNVTVTSPSATVQTQADLDKTATAERDALIKAGTAIAAGAQLTKATGVDGTATWQLRAGDEAQNLDVNQFLPAGPLRIATGDTVHWTTPTFEPHTVTFLGGSPEPDFLTEVPNPAGGTLTTFNPAALLPAGGSTYGGTGFANSGVMDVTGDFPAGSAYSLTFTTPGTYEYICLLHADQGMAGTVIVGGAAAAPVSSGGGPAGSAGAGAPRTGAIAAPDTGFGPDAQQTVGWLPAILVLGISGAALMLAGARPLRKHSA